jgi:hypothetical protein
MRVEQLEADILGGDLPAQKVQRTAVYLRAMTLLTRARLELDRNNLGFAREQVEAAQMALNELVPPISVTEDEFGDEQILAAMIERLDLVLLDLPRQPAVAAQELEAVWKLFMQATQSVQFDDIEAGGE